MSLIVLLIFLVLLGVAAWFVAQATFIARPIKVVIYIVIGIVVGLMVLSAIAPETMDRVRNEPVPTLD